MKNQLQNLLKICFFLLLFIFFSCEKDIYEEQIYQSKVKIEKFSLRDNNSISKINPNLFKAVSKIKNTKQNILGKIVFDSINNIYYDDENGIKISKDNYESYSFKIIKESGKIENLLFSKDLNGDFKTYKVKYDFTEDEIKNLSQQEIENSPKIFSELAVAENGQLQILSKCVAVLDCETITSPRDDGDPNGPNAITYCTYHLEGCGGGESGSSSGSSGSGSSGSGSGGSGASGGSGPSGGGASGGGASGGSGSNMSSGGGSFTPTYSNSNPPIITTPVHGNPQINHLGKLYTLTQVAPSGQQPNIIRNKINTFKNQLKTATQENGVEFRRGPIVNGALTYNPIYPIAFSYNKTVFGQPAINTSVYIHFHPDTEFTNSNGVIELISAVPSDGDFEAFAKNFDLMGPNSSRNDLTSMAVTRNGLYAMRVGNPEQILAFKQYLSVKAQKDDFELRFEINVIKKGQNKAIEKFNAQGGGTEAQLEALIDLETRKWLARFILDFNTKTLDTGILLFYGDINLGETTWTQLQTTSLP